MGEVVSSAFPDDRHARRMLAVVRAAGVDAPLVPAADLAADRIPEWLDINRPAYGTGKAVCCVMLVPEDQKERAEVASHKYYGLCRWCGHRLKGQVIGDCPRCGTPIDPFEQKAGPT